MQLTATEQKQQQTQRRSNTHGSSVGAAVNLRRMIRSQLFETGKHGIADTASVRGGFDERINIPQSPRLMRTVSFVLAFCSMLGFATAQTQPATSTRPMSLMDCLQEALQRNIDLQIERYNPEIATYALRGAYGGWDPAFSIGGRHEHRMTGGGIDPNNPTNFIPPFEASADIFDSTIDGVTPWGFNYNLFGNIQENVSLPAAGRQDNTQGQIGIQMTQPLLKNFWIDSTRLNIQINKLALTQSEATLKQKIIDTATDVETAYYDLIFARESVKVQEKAVELAAQSVRENRKKVEVGTLAPLDEKQAESQEATSRSDLLQAQRVLAAAENALKRRLTDNFAALQPVEIIPSDPLTYPEIEFNVQKSWGQALRERPDLQAVRLDVEKQGVQLKYDRNQLYPQLDLIGSYGYGAGGSLVQEFHQGFNDFAEQNHPFYSYGARMTVPLANTTARNRYKANKVSMQQLVLTVKQLEQTIMVQVDDAIKLAKASYERIQATREARKYSEAALEAEQKKLESGKSTSFEVLRLQRDLTTARSEEIRAQTEYRRNLAQLSSFEATTLTRLGLNVSTK